MLARLGIGEDERSALAGPPWSAAAPVAALAIVAITVVDAIAGHFAIITSLLVLAPLSCALVARWRDTALAAVLALVAALVSLAWNSEFGTTYVIGLVVVAIGGLVAVQIALLRAAGEVSAERFRLIAEIADISSRPGSLTATVERVLAILVPAFADFARIDAEAGPLGERGALELRPQAARRPEAVAPSADGTALAVPLKARGDMLGVLELAFGPSPRRYARATSPSPACSPAVSRSPSTTPACRASCSARRARSSTRRSTRSPRPSRSRTPTAGRSTPTTPRLDLLRLASARGALRRASPATSWTASRLRRARRARPAASAAGLPGPAPASPTPAPLLVRNVVRATGEERWLRQQGDRAARRRRAHRAGRQRHRGRHRGQARRAAPAAAGRGERGARALAGPRGDAAAASPRPRCRRWPTGAASTLPGAARRHRARSRSPTPTRDTSRSRAASCASATRVRMDEPPAASPR